MIVSRLIGVRIGSWTLVCASLLGVPAGYAADCPGHADAIGTSRTLVVDPREHTRIGTMQYPETLPLRDHEVVLTFDDGPLPRNSNQVLQILADNCAKATFFIIGQQALANPEGVRKYVAAGHSIGTHSQTHPLKFERMPIDQIRKQVDDGIASTSAALSDPGVLAPFFRFPGLLRSDAGEEYLASRGIMVWSTDFLADDWHRISPSRVADLAITRMEAAGKGILLLHDIQARTVAALPKILHEMKARGYHIVHVVPATPQQPKTPTDPQDWQMHPPSETGLIAHWPKIPNFVFAETAMLPAPAGSEFGIPERKQFLFEEPFERLKRHGVPLPREAPWPHVAALPAEDTSIALPVPEKDLFEMPAGAQSTFRLPSPRIDVAREVGTETRSNRAYAKTGHAVRSHVGRGGHRAVRVEHATQSSTPNHPAHGKTAGKRSVRVATLKKR
jgi:peptidoglycan/xylan/chitin deacetylase (PgdA/CDA1 family)